MAAQNSLANRQGPESGVQAQAIAIGLVCGCETEDSELHLQLETLLFVFLNNLEKSSNFKPLSKATKVMQNRPKPIQYHEKWTLES